MAKQNQAKADKTAVRKVTKALPCTLNDDEILKYGRDIARAHAERERIATEAKSVAKDYSSKVAEQDAIIGKLSPRVHSGIETRDVECEETKNWSKGTVIVRRNDTGETVEARPMREEEKQVEITVGDQEVGGSSTNENE